MPWQDGRVWWAACLGQEEPLRALLNAGADPHPTEIDTVPSPLPGHG